MARTLPLILLLIPFCISCNRYQYATINSNQMDKNDRNEFVFENDSIVLIYNFLGQDLGPEIFIENKLSEPIYIDWRGSALIANSHSNSYAPIQLDPYGNICGGPGGPTMDRIPPRSNIDKTPIVLATSYMNHIPGAKYRRAKYMVEGFNRRVKTARFSESNSPLHFTSYITYMVGAADGAPQRVEHSFYISKVMNTMGNPVTCCRMANTVTCFIPPSLLRVGAL